LDAHFPGVNYRLDDLCTEAVRFISAKEAAWQNASPQQNAGPRAKESLLTRKGCRFWYAQFYDQNGKAVRVSTKTAVKQEALDFLRREMG